MKTLSLAVASLALATTAAAQSGPPGTGWFFSIEGLYAYQGDADLDGGAGSFTVNRSFLQAGATYSFGGGQFAGLSLSVGEQDYEFDTSAPALWDTVEDYAFSAIYRATDGNRTWFIAPTLRYDYESGAERSDGETYGLFAGISWVVSDTLTIGPAFGVFTELGENDDVTAFPALLIDWQITERLSLSTGPTIGASRGPGLTLGYEVNDALNIGLTGRYEELRFALNDSGPAPGGVGEDRSFPLVFSVGYNPNPGVSINAFAGVELGGRLTLEDATGAVISETEYDPAPLFGLQALFRF